MLKKYNYFAFCFCTLSLLACKATEQQAPLNIKQEISGTPIEINLESSIDSELPLEHFDEQARAYDGLSYNGTTTLRPSISDKAKVVLVLGSTKHASVHIEELEWKYDGVSKSLVSASAFTGTGSNRRTTPLALSNVPEALLKAGGLRMMLMMASAGSYDPQNKEIRMSGDARGIRIAKEARGVIDLKVPYISNWADVSYNGKTIALTPGQSFRFVPQGRVLRVTVTNNQSVYNDLRLRGLAIQTNSISFFGKYSLANINQQWVQNKKQPSWIEEDGNVAVRLQGDKNYKREIMRRNNNLQAEQVLQANYLVDLDRDEDLGSKGAKSTFYVWFAPLAQPYPTNNSNNTRQNAFTRFYVRATRSGENGDDVRGTYSFMPAYHSTRTNFTKRGLDLALSIDNAMVVQPMQYFANTRIVTGQRGVENPNDKWHMKMNYAFDEQLSQFYTVRFGLNELKNNGYFDSNYNRIDKSKDDITWFAPKVNEMRALIPIDAGADVDRVFNVYNAAGQEANNISEHIDHYVGNQWLSDNYKASYYRLPDVSYTGNERLWRGEQQIVALRYMKDNDHSMKTAFVYELASSKNRVQDNSIQYHYRVIAYHLGNAFPEIQTAKDFYRHKSEIVNDPIYWWRENSRYIQGVWNNNKNNTLRDMIRLHLHHLTVVKATDTRAPYTESIVNQRIDGTSGYNNTEFGLFMMRRTL